MAAAFDLEVHDWVTSLAIVQTWLFIHYGCQAFLGPDGTVVAAKLWSVG